MNKLITLESAKIMRDDALSSDEVGAEETAAILSQLITHLETPKVIQIIQMEEGVIAALKSDGSLWKSMGGIKWFQMVSP